MQCSICEKMFAATLSICPSCGAMQTQHNQAESSLRLLSIEKISTSDLQLEIEDPAATEIVSMSAENEFYGNLEQQQIKRGQTTTLLEFPAKKSKDQEWRDEIKNRIRQRKENDLSAAINGRTTSDQTPKTSLKSLSPNAESSLVINLKPKLAEKQPSKSKDVVAEALKRIERSRQKFENDEFVAAEMSKDASLKLAENEQKKSSETANSTLTLVPSRKVLPAFEEELKDYDAKPLAAKSERKSVFTVPLNIPSAVGNGAKPKTDLLRESRTNISDLEDDLAIETSLKSVRKVSAGQAMLDYQELAERVPTAATATAIRRQTNEDYAPLGQRFAAGLIDFGLCGSAAIAFSHFALGALPPTNWLLATIIVAAALFLYLTATLLFTGTTIGLRLFGMFVVTAENGEVPSALQIVISNTTYLLTLATGGVGFLTVFFSSEQRALPDLLSGTVVVKE